MRTLNPYMYITLLTVGLINLEYATSLLAFDCGGPAINISTFDLLNTDRCDAGDSPIKTQNVTIQLIQLKRWSNIHVFHCKIQVIRTIHYCGMHSHVSLVRGGLNQYVYPMSREQCLYVHRTSTWSPSPNVILDGLNGNATHSRNTVISGNINNDGSCKGGSYADNTGSWTDVVVQVAYVISLYDQEVTYDIDSSTVKLPSGTSCDNSAIECIDIEKGFTYWTSTYGQECSTRRHHVLYEGPAMRMEEYTDDGTKSQNIIYTVQNEGFSFTYMIKSRTSLCGISMYTTEHPRLLIHHPADGTFYFLKGNMVTEDMDMFAYINSKFVYVEQHMKTQMVSLYHNTMQHKCAIEQQTLHNLMNLAISDPELFAYSYMKVPGYTAIRAGELIHVIKCIPVEVSLRNADRCYNDLPITYNNRSMFMTPRNHLIVSKGNEIPCTPMVYPAYKLQGSWYEMSPGLHETTQPQRLSLSSTVTWKYKSPYQLAQSGIYSSEAIDKLREHIMFPSERQAITNVIAQGVNKMDPDLQHLTLAGLMDSETIEKLAQGYADKMWGAFVWVGNAVSGVMGIWFSWKVLCFCWNTIIHGLSLYRTFGVSLHLLTAVSGALSTYFLHKHTHKKTYNATVVTEDPFPRNPSHEETCGPVTQEDVSHVTDVDHVIVRHDRYPVVASAPLLSKHQV